MTWRCTARQDERFWVGIGLSFDERNHRDRHRVENHHRGAAACRWTTPEGSNSGRSFRAKPDVEYDVSFSLLRRRGGAWRGYSARRGVPQRVESEFRDRCDRHAVARASVPAGRGRARGGRFAVRLRAWRRGRTRRLLGCRSAPRIPIPAILPFCRARTVLGIEGISIHRHYVALQYRAESLTHIAVMTKDAAAEDFLAGRPWKFTELVPHALEDDWDVDESVDEINEERAEVWGALDQLAAAQGEGSAVHGVSRRGDDVVGRRDRRRACRGRRGACIRSAWVATPRMTRRACATRSPATRAPASCMTIDPDDRRGSPAEARHGAGWISIRATTWSAGCGSPRATASASPSRLVWRQGRARRAIRRCSSPGTARMRSVAIRDSRCLASACSTAACCTRVPHIRGGGEMGRAWYEQGHLLNKKHSFEDFVDAVRALQRAGLASPAAHGGRWRFRRWPVDGCRGEYGSRMLSRALRRMCLLWMR